jgi:hypothetical protein
MQDMKTPDCVVTFLSGQKSFGLELAANVEKKPKMLLPRRSQTLVDDNFFLI